ncbi:MAG: pirin family protein [Candidatus Woesearchaeota archaeon]
MNIIRADSRGKTRIGWLNSRHSFSFGDYYNPERMNFGTLRVLNDDIIAAHSGFDEHPHANMEIITIMLSGELTHTDSMGHEEKLVPSEVQVMSAGSGIMHSEYNNSNSPVHLLQIWINTKEKNITPRYDQKKFPIIKNNIMEIVSGEKNDTLYIHQDAIISIAKYDSEKEFSYTIRAGRGVYLFVIVGEIVIEEEKLTNGDAAEIKSSFKALTKKNSEVLLMDVKF